MGAPIRSSNEIDSIINRGQHSIADLGHELVNAAKLGKDSNDPVQREKIYRLILLRAALQNLLTPDGVIKNFYLDSANEIPKNKVLDVIAKLAKSFDGTSIPFLGQKRIPLYFFPSSSGLSSSGGASGGPASPGGITFQNTSVDSPGEVVDSFNASDSEFAFYIYSVRGSNSGEGNRTGILILSWRGTDVKIAGDIKTEDTGSGLNTDGVTFSAAVNAGLLELTCNVPTDNWVVKGTRILFQNISFQNPLGPLPTGGTTGQLLVKSTDEDYETEWTDNITVIGIRVASQGSNNPYAVFVNSVAGTGNGLIGWDIVGGSLISGSLAGAFIFGTPSAKPIQFGTNNAIRLTIDENGDITARKSIKLGVGLLSSSSARVGGVVYSSVTSIGNSGVSDTTLYSYTVDSYALPNNGDTLEIFACGINASPGSNFVRIKIGGVTRGEIIISPATDNTWMMRGKLVRTSSSDCLFTYEARGGIINTIQISTAIGPTQSASTTISVTAQGAASNEIIGKHVQITYQPTI